MGEVRAGLQEEEGWVELRDRGWEETLKLDEKRVGVKGSDLKLNQGSDDLSREGLFVLLPLSTNYRVLGDRAS